MDSDRKLCDFCGEELAHSAYYRHLHDKDGSICPGKLQSVTEQSGDFMDSSELDSTFDLGSKSEEFLHDDYQIGDDYISSSDSLTSDTDSDMDFSENSPTSSEGEEVWEISEDESIGAAEEDDKVSDAVHDMILF